MVGFNELRAIGKVLQEAGKIEQYQQILAAQQQLLEMQKKIGDLDGENKKLREELEVKGSLVPEGNLYWLENDGKRDGPFCTKCRDSEQKLIRLHQAMHSGRMYCPECKTVGREGAEYFKPVDHRRNSAM